MNFVQTFSRVVLFGLLFMGIVHPSWLTGYATEPVLALTVMFLAALAWNDK